MDRCFSDQYTWLRIIQKKQHSKGEKGVYSFKKILNIKSFEVSNNSSCNPEVEQIWFSVEFQEERILCGCICRTGDLEVNKNLLIIESIKQALKTLKTKENILDC